MRRIALLKLLGACLTKFISTSIGGVPDVNVSSLNGFPKLRVVAVVKPVRLRLPTTSPATLGSGAAIDVAVAGIVKVNAPVSKSPLAKFKTPLTAECAPSVTPAALLIVKLGKTTLPEVD